VSFQSYLCFFVAVVSSCTADELEESLQERRQVFWLVFVPALVPAIMILAFPMWLGLNVYVHSPDRDD